MELNMHLLKSNKWEKTDILGKPIGVDRENKVLRGYVVAEKGVFKNADRGEFDDLSLDGIVKLWGEHRNGLKSRFTHPSLSDDGLGKFLGRSKNARIEGTAVRADLHLDPTSFNTPHGNLGGYIMDLAENDPGAFSSSLVLKADKLERLDEHKRPILSKEGKQLPPLWRPTRLHASDVVDTGEAAGDFMSMDMDVEGLPDELVRRGTFLLNEAFPGKPREVVQERLQAWVNRYLDLRYGEQKGRSVKLLKKKLDMQLRSIG